jgi:cell wall-associated NlpC family hydrolase
MPALILAAGVSITGCAVRGGTPRPFPTPGDRRPPAATTIGALPDDASESAHALLDTALGLVGSPYHRGGLTPETGFDCSGFVAWVFGQHGRVLPRTVIAQFGSGGEVRGRALPHAADLVFFDVDRAGPSHVGIALGDGRFVHAPNARGAVRVESLSAPYWAHRYVGARRILVDEVVAGAPPMHQR